MKFGRPEAVVELESVRHCEMTPLLLAECIGIARHYKAVLFYACCVEIGSRPGFASNIHTELGDCFAKCSAIFRIPIQICERSWIKTCRLQHRFVVGNADRVPVLWKAILFPVPRPKLVKVSDVNRGIDLVL